MSYYILEHFKVDRHRLYFPKRYYKLLHYVISKGAENLSYYIYHKLPSCNCVDVVIAKIYSS